MLERIGARAHGKALSRWVIVAQGEAAATIFVSAVSCRTSSTRKRPGGNRLVIVVFAAVTASWAVWPTACLIVDDGDAVVRLAVAMANTTITSRAFVRRFCGGSSAGRMTIILGADIWRVLFWWRWQRGLSPFHETAHARLH